MNPTGTTYLQANVGYVWANADVYEIQQTDLVEGAAMGASFGGIGVDNQPHQLLLNKANFLHVKQLADEAIIAGLNTLTNFITSMAGATGWVKLGVNDVALGSIVIIAQWGSISLLPYGAGGSLANQLPAFLSFNFPIAFTSQVFFILPSWQTNDTSSTSATSVVAEPYALAPLMPLGLSTNTIAHGIPPGNAGTSHIPGTGRPFGLTAINWVALGL